MRTYKIKKNRHYSNFIPKIKCLNKKNDFTFNNSLNVIFDESCRYEIEEKSCVNKLFGHSIGLFNVHKHSYRFGWTYDNKIDKIIIWIYLYNDSKLYKKKIFECSFNTIYKFNIITQLNLEKNTYNTTFFINDNIVKERKFKTNKINKMLLTLGFYFGGNTKAPHNMLIKYVKY